jgi:hypothetical protein
MSTEASIRSVCKEVEELLLRKNKAYGDAALSPLNVFSPLGAEDSIKVRLDDKLKRIQNVGLNDATEDTLMDLVGYMILLIIKRNESHHLQEHIRQQRPAPHQPAAGATENPGGQQLHPDNAD